MSTKGTKIKIIINLLLLTIILAIIYYLIHQSLRIFSKSCFQQVSKCFWRCFFRYTLSNCRRSLNQRDRQAVFQIFQVQVMGSGRLVILPFIGSFHLERGH